MPETIPASWTVQDGHVMNGDRLICIVARGPASTMERLREAEAERDKLAQLIAAAPKLLAACKQMAKSLSGSASDFSGMLAHRAVDAAIAKAEGGQ